MHKYGVKDIRAAFLKRLKDGHIESNGTIEILDASFIADEEAIFGSVNKDYAQREVSWYLSQSLFVQDIPGEVPKIWKDIATSEGLINSNYGWCIFSKDNYHQFHNAVMALVKDPDSRQAVMIYNRPTMHIEAFFSGMKDFMCTFSTQLMIRDDRLDYFVSMRSNDAVFGYKNDRHWHDFVHDMAITQLRSMGFNKLEKGSLYWHANSLHVYPRHFKLLEE